VKEIFGFDCYSLKEIRPATTIQPAVPESGGAVRRPESRKLARKTR
jgi:hypothetical protein